MVGVPLQVPGVAVRVRLSCGVPVTSGAVTPAGGGGGGAARAGGGRRVHGGRRGGARRVAAARVRGGDDDADGVADVGGREVVGGAGGAGDVGAVGAGGVAALPLVGEGDRGRAGPRAVVGGERAAVL